VKKIIAWVMVVLVFSSVILTGCKTKENSKSSMTIDTSKERLEDYSDMMELSVFFYGWQNPPKSVENTTSKFLKDNFKIDLSKSVWEKDNAQARNKLAMMIASGEIPDVIIFNSDGGNSKILSTQLENSGLVIPREELLEKYMPNYTKFASTDVLNVWRNSKDKKLYALPSFTISPDKVEELSVCSLVPTIIRPDILQKAGVEFKQPKTPDEFYDLLKLFKELGKDEGIIPIQFGDLWFADTLLGSMFGRPAYGVKLDDNEKRLVSQEWQPYYLDYLKFISKLYRDKLLNQDMFINKQGMDGLVERGKVAVTLSAPTLYHQRKLSESGINITPVPINIPKAAGVDRVYYQSVATLGDIPSYISTKAKDPIRISKFIDWGYTFDGIIALSLGAPVKGENEFYKENNEYIYDTELSQKISKGEQKLSLGNWSYFINLPFSVNLIEKYDPKIFAKNAPGVPDYIKQGQTILKDTLYTDIKYEKYNLEEKGPIEKSKWVDIVNTRDKNVASIIMNSKSDAEVEANYNKMMDELKKSGYIDVEKERYTIYKKVNQ